MELFNGIGALKRFFHLTESGAFPLTSFARSFLLILFSILFSLYQNVSTNQAKGAVRARNLRGRQDRYPTEPMKRLCGCKYRFIPVNSLNTVSNLCYTEMNSM